MHASIGPPVIGRVIASWMLDTFLPRRGLDEPVTETSPETFPRPWRRCVLTGDGPCAFAAMDPPLRTTPLR